MSERLFIHKPHPHIPMNVNELHKIEQEVAGFNQRLAVGLTRVVGTVWTAYTFAGLAIIGLLAILGVFSPIVALLVAWLSQTLIQLVLLPVIMVGQNVLSRKQELQADATFADAERACHDIDQVVLHLNAQDEQILLLTHFAEHQSDLISQLIKRIDRATNREVA